MTTIHCPHCGQSYELTPEQVPQYAGRTITCTACKQPFAVAPSGSGTQPVAPPATVAPPPTAYARPGASMQPQQPQRTSGLAIASLVAGILSFCIPIIGGLVAIVLGIIGLTKASDPRVGGRGLAIWGIVLGAMSFFVTPCAISVLLPSLNRARETANRVKCASNLKQIGQSLQIYASTNNGQYPPDLATLVNTTALSLETLTCPSSNDTPAAGTATLNAGGHLSYVYVPGQSAASPADAVLLYEPLGNHDNDGINVLFGDGYVEFLVRTKAEPLIAALEAGENPPRAGPVERP